MAAAGDAAALRRMLAAVRRGAVRELGGDKHKGQCGRVGVVGGCRMYTGAPYYAAMASLRAGADLAYVFCTADAAGPIKSYSPELMVDPVLVDGAGGDDERQRVVAALAAYMPRLHVLLFGPGLGRDEFTLDCVAAAIAEARGRDLPVVLDGDALFLLARRPALIHGYRRAVLTPNVAEFARLWRAVSDGEDPPPRAASARSAGDERAAVLSRLLGGVTVLLKGPRDTVSNGGATASVGVGGSPRRCGGQGDVVAGATAAFLASALADGGPAAGGAAPDENPVMLAAFGASCLVRVAAAQAFQKSFRSTVTTDILPELPAAMQRLFPVDVEASLAHATPLPGEPL